jgi:fibro-slime domain-containing protein
LTFLVHRFEGDALNRTFLVQRLMRACVWGVGRGAKGQAKMTTTNFKTTVTRAGMLAAAAVAVVSVSPQAAMGGGYGGTGGQAGSFDLNAINAFHVTGILRDFSESHPDFGDMPEGGLGLYVDMVESSLDADGKPTYTGSGDLVDPASISGSLFGFDDSLKLLTEELNPAVQSDASFRQWFREIPTMNTSAVFPITLKRNDAIGRWVFNDRFDTHFTHLAAMNKNRHFTWEAVMKFTYVEKAVDQTFVFGGNDDMWVYLNGELIADIGGMHGLTSVEVDMKDLGLNDGELYELKVFYAERDGGESRVRIESPVVLFPGELPGVIAQFD